MRPPFDRVAIPGARLSGCPHYPHPPWEHEHIEIVVTDGQGLFRRIRSGFLEIGEAIALGGNVGTSRQGPQTVRTAHLERECLRLRMEGLSHRAIARQLGVAPSTAYKRVQHGLLELNRGNAAQAAELRDLEALRLDEMQDAVWESRARPAPHPRPLGHHRTGHRRGHRHRHLRGHRHGCRGTCRPGGAALLHHRRDLQRLQRALLRRVRHADPDLRQLLLLRLRVTGRTGGLVHRLEHGRRIRHFRLGGGRQLDRLFHQPARPRRHPPAEALTEAPLAFTDGHLVATGHLFNLPAVAIVLALTWLCYVGIRESSGLNALMVLVKVGLIVIVVVAGYRYVNPANWHPFIPEPQGDGKYGWSGIMRGAAMVFFAYIGFEATSTAAQECKNPQRDLPFGILVSLVICTVLYLAMAAVLTGLIPYTLLDTRRAGGHRRRRASAARLAARRGGGRRDDRPVLGDPGDDHRAATHLHDHGARRHAAAGVRQGASEIPHAAHQHRDHRQRASPCWPRCFRSTCSPT